MKITCFIYPRYHPKIIEDIPKNVQKFVTQYWSAAIVKNNETNGHHNLVEFGANVDKIHKKTCLVLLEAGFFKL